MIVGAIVIAWVIHGRGRSDPKASTPIPTPAVSTPAPGAGLVSPAVTVKNRQFVLGGQVTQLRGFDVGVASSPVYSQAAHLGANFVRITVPWSLVEPVKPTGPANNLSHHWDKTVLSELDQEVQALGDQNVQVLIDFHQFHWSPYYAQVDCKAGVETCKASGVPAWYYQGRYPQTSAGESAAKADFWTTDRRSSLFYYSAFAEMMARRYGQFSNVVGYELFNEPHAGHLPDTTETTNTILAWQASLYRLMHAVDPSRTMFVMCRGGGEGVGTANLSQFGPGAKIALDFHDYYNGESSGGLNPQGDDWVPSWPATHNQTLDPTTGYTGTAAAQAAVLNVPITAAEKAGIPLLVGEWGIHADDTNASTYTSQMLDLFQSTGVSQTRWVLAPGSGFNLLSEQRPHTPNAQALQMQSAFSS